MDEFVAIPKSLLGTFEGNGNDGPFIAIMETQNIKGDFGVDVVRLQETCQPLYLGSCSTKLATTMLLMNICTIHGVSTSL
jgi:hypothetical protein